MPLHWNVTNVPNKLIANPSAIWTVDQLAHEKRSLIITVDTFICSIASAREHSPTWTWWHRTLVQETEIVQVNDPHNWTTYRSFDTVPCCVVQTRQSGLKGLSQHERLISWPLECSHLPWASSYTGIVKPGGSEPWGQSNSAERYSSTIH